jgi:hypothetical protein
MSLQNSYVRFLPEPIRQLAAADVTESSANPAWAQVGTTGLANPSRLLIIQNYTNQLVSISWDGSADNTAGVSGNINLQLEAGCTFTFDEATNSSGAGTAATGIGTTFWAQYTAGGTAPSTGNVNVATIYGVQSKGFVSLNAINAPIP